MLLALVEHRLNFDKIPTANAVGFLFLYPVHRALTQYNQRDWNMSKTSESTRKPAKTAEPVQTDTETTQFTELVKKPVKAGELGPTMSGSEILVDRKSVV